MGISWDYGGDYHGITWQFKDNYMENQHFYRENRENDGKITIFYLLVIGEMGS